MPNNISSQTVNMGPYSGPETFNPTTLYSAGDLGKRFVWSGKRYQIVQLDTASQSSVANGLLFWATKTQYTVTARVTNTANTQNVNGVAGRAPVAGAALSYLAMQIEGNGLIVSVATTATVGDSFIAKTGDGASSGTIVAQGTAPTNMVVGIVAATSTTTPVSVDMFMQIEVD